MQRAMQRGQQSDVYTQFDDYYLNKMRALNDELNRKCIAIAQFVESIATDVHSINVSHDNVSLSVNA